MQAAMQACIVPWNNAAHNTEQTDCGGDLFALESQNKESAKSVSKAHHCAQI